MSSEERQPGDVFQIIDEKRKGWMGAFVLATEVRTWGIQGFVHHIDSHEAHSSVFIRLRWDQIEFIGRAVLIPAG